MRYEAKCVGGEWYVWDSQRSDYLRTTYGIYGGGKLSPEAAKKMADALNKETASS